MATAKKALPSSPAAPEGSGAGQKGLKSGAISFSSTIVIAVVSGGCRRRPMFNSVR